MINNTGKERAEAIGAYVLETLSTVRATANVFGISKSTVHKDLTEKLKHINPVMFDNVKHVLEKNKNERHIRGGEASRQKYMLKKQIKNRE